MTIDSYNIILYTGLFLVPGYIIDEIISTIMPQKTYSDKVKTIRFIGYSVLNFFIWIWLYWLLHKHIESERTLYWALIICCTLITSTITGFIIGLLRKKELIRFVFKKLNIQAEHPIPTAWDYKFSKVTTQRWVLVTLANGTYIRGLYSYKSLASTDEQYRDIYIEEVYLLDENEQWIKMKRTDGVWINPSEIKMIEFFEI